MERTVVVFSVYKSFFYFSELANFFEQKPGTALPPKNRQFGAFTLCIRLQLLHEAPEAAVRRRENQVALGSPPPPRPKRHDGPGVPVAPGVHGLTPGAWSEDASRSVPRV